MSWFRFHDAAIDHPKILALSDGAFRLWIEGGTYCTRHLTDGRIAATALRGFRYYAARRLAELLTQRLWERDDAGIYRLHDYHDWNDDKDTIAARRDQARDRTRRWRAKHLDVAAVVPGDASRNANVPNGMDLRSEVGIQTRSDPFVDPTVTDRAARFLERYEQQYQTLRNSRYLLRPMRDYAAAVTLCATWADDDRLDKLAAIFLTTDHEFAAQSSRTVPQFAALASWADGRLAEWERTHGGNGAGAPS